MTAWWNVAANFDENSIFLTVRVLSDLGTAPPNLITNGSFENDLSGWNGYGKASLARLSADAHEGGFSVQVTGPTPGGSDFGLNDSPSWITDSGPAGTRYEVSAWVRSSSSTSPVRLRIREYKNGVRVGSRQYSATQSLTSEWKKISMEYVSRATGSSFDFQILNIGHVAGDVFLIDDVAIRKLDTGASIAMNIQSPTPLSVLTAGGNCLVQWSAPAIPSDSVVVSATTDAGATWSVIGVSHGDNEVSWHLPAAPSSMVALLIESFANGVVVGDAVSDLLNVTAGMLATDDGLAFPRELHLAPPQPTPFQNRTTLAYTVARRSHVRVQVFDVNGRLVTTLADRIETPGNKSVVWTGTDEHNARVGAGIYLIRLSDGETVKVQRAVRLR